MHHIKNTNGSHGSAVPEAVSFLTRGDVEDVAELSTESFPRSRELSKAHLCETIIQLYLQENRMQEDICSLVSRSDEGRVTGFLGVTAKNFQYGGKNIRIANCHHLMATSDARRKLIPLKLLQQFLSGPQDVSFADGSVEAVRRVWKRLGGAVSINDCIYYKVPLKPLSFASRPIHERLKKPLSSIIAGVSSGVDSLAGMVRVPLFFRPGQNVRLVNLSPGFLLELLRKISRDYAIFPRYTLSEIEQLFQLLQREPRYGTFHKAGMMDDNGEIVGSFVYYCQKGGVCEVLQAVSVAGREESLFNALTRHAWARGGIELSGRLMTRHLRTPFSTRSVCIPGRMWTLVHSSDEKLTLEILSGNAYLTRLEGDPWLL